MTLRSIEPFIWRRTGGLLLAAVAAASCRPETPASLRVEYAGCRNVLAGPICLVAADTELTLWIETDVDAEIAIAVDGVRSETEPEASETLGRRYRIATDGARQLTVTASRPDATDATWHLALDIADELLWRDEVSAKVRAGELERARELATAALEAEATAAGLPLGSLARIAMLQGDLQAAEDLFRRALSSHRDRGGLFDFTRDAGALFYLLVYRRHDLAAARDVLEGIPEGWDGPAESVYVRDYYRGLLAALTGDLRTALRSLEAAAEQARRLALVQRRLAAEQVLLRQLQNLGRRREAEALADRLLAGGDDLHACERGELLNNLGWTALLALESRSGEDFGDPAPALEQALSEFTDGCPQLGHEQINVRLNLALAHLYAGRPAAAARELEEIHRLGTLPELRMSLWKLEIEARLELVGGRPADALERYDEMAALAAASLTPAAELRAALGRGRALEAAGDSVAALDAYGDAERRLDEAVRRVPLTEGRELFLAQRQEGIRRYLELLLQAGRREEAFAVARRSRSRILRGVLRQERLERLSPEEQQRWDRAVSAYRRDRDELDDAAGGDWRLPRPRLRRLEAERQATHRDLLRQLDDALAMLDRRAPDPGSLAPPPEAGSGELLLLYHPLGSGWVGFAHDGRRLIAERLRCDSVERPVELLADCLLVPFAEQLESSSRLRILPYGPLRQTDFHALLWKGEPLLAAAEVIYDLDLPGIRQPHPAADGLRDALLIADTAGDLPAARREANAVAKALTADWRVRRLQGDDARGDAVRSLLPRVSLLHYAGHAAYEGDGGWRSALRLAGGGLTVGDVLLLERAPRWVVLSGCETGRTTELAAAEAIGLAHAFVAAGSESVVATTRPVSDRDALRLTQSFYHRWAGGTPPAAALRQAQLELRGVDPAADWAAFRLLEP